MGRGHADDVLDITWAPDGTALVSASIENLCYIWDMETHKMKLRLANHHHYVQGVAWDPLSKHIASQSADRTCRWVINAQHHAALGTESV